MDKGQTHVQLTRHEAVKLAQYHTSKADYFLDCKRVNVACARRNPQPKNSPFTARQWKNRANRFEQLRAWHRKRAQIFRKLSFNLPFGE